MAEATVNGKNHVRYTSLDANEKKICLPSDTLCGCGPCKPTVIQRLSHPVIFTGHAGLLLAIVICSAAYFSGILTTIERQFQLSSSEVAALTVLNDASSLCLVLFVTYFGQKSHRPRWIACGAILMSVGLICCALPHFLSDPIDPQSLIEGGTGTTNQASGMSGVCDVTSKSAGNQTYITGDRNLYNSTICHDGSSKEGIGQVKWLVIGQIIMGCGGAPLFPLTLSYIDDAVKKHKFTSYTAFMFIAITIGPIGGFFLTSTATSRYVDFDRIPADQIPNIPQYDPRWIGAWWLGFPLFSILLAVAAIPMFFYPKVMTSKSPVLDDEKESQGGDEQDEDVTTPIKLATGGIFQDAPGGVLKILKGLLLAITRLVCNVPLMLMCFGAAAETAIGVISSTFQVKFLQTQFGTSPATAAMLMGGLMVPCVTVAQIVSAVICRRFKFDTKQCAGFIVSCHLFSFLFMITHLFIGCGNSPVAGINIAYSNSDNFITNHPEDPSVTPRYQSIEMLQPESVCNRNCLCPEEIFRPVCGADGISYISPCHAGCTQFNASDSKKYYDCACIHVDANNTDSGEDHDNTAVPGLCPGSCNALQQLVAFITTGMVSVFTMSLTFNPKVFVTFRLVEPDDRAIALGMKSLITKCLAFFPAPILMGMVINSTCILWQYTCGDRGSCWLYDVLAYRHLFIGINVGLKCLSIICYIALFLTVKPTKEDKVEEKEMSNLDEKVAPK